MIDSGKETWAANELRDAELGDARLNKRLVKVVGTLASHAASSVPEACDSWAETKGVYSPHFPDHSHGCVVIRWEWCIFEPHT